MILQMRNMRKRKKLIALFVLTVLIALVLVSCSDNALKFRNDGNTGNLIDDENDRYYVYCKGYLQAAAIKPVLYARGDRKEKLYEVEGLDPAEWLSEDISVGVAFLFRASNIDEPTLEEFETERIHITIAETAVIQVGLIGDKEDVDKIVGEFLYNKEVAYPDFVTDYFTFNFESAKYNGIYYVLTYLVDEKNNAYLYDRWTGR